MSRDIRNLSARFFICAGLISLVACGSPEQDDPVEDVADSGNQQTDDRDMGQTPSPEDASSDTPDVGTPDVGTDEPDLADSGQEEADMGADLGEEEDLTVIGDLGNPEPTDFPCFQELSEAWPLNDTVSASAAVTVSDESASSFAVDASAGGRMEAIANSFTYVDLDTASVVAIDDVSSLQDLTWDLAFKRVAIRSNGGHSGSGQGSVAKLSGTSFEEVTQAPADTEFVTDESADDSCVVRFDPINAPYTAINLLNVDNPTGTESWYSYGGPGGLAPTQGDVYVVKNAEGTTSYKVSIDAWEGGVFTLRWAPLAAQ